MVIEKYTEELNLQAKTSFLSYFLPLAFTLSANWGHRASLQFNMFSR